MSKLLIIVLVKNEERHLPRFFKKLSGLNDFELLVNDNGSTDNSKSICQKNNAVVIEKEWLGNQAAQFNWILDNYNIKSEWILRLDADEYLLPDLINEINEIIANPNSFNAFYLKRRHYVSGRWIKHGMYPTNIVRLFKNGFARYDSSMLMDEHLKVTGSVSTLQNDFIDESLLSHQEWWDKHVNYAKREANMLINSDKSQFKKNRKLYYKTPVFVRPFIFFVIIYVFKGGFFNGKIGFRWFLYQVLFYRFLVDIYLSTIYNSKKIQ